MSSENFRAILVQHGSKEGNNYINNISQIIQFLPSLSGETYKNHFTTDGQDPYIDPAGNNILLLAISRACAVNENKDSVTAIANAIIDDARGKLSPIDFLNFINYRFINPPAASYDMEKDGGYGNSALTLAIKSGLISVAQNLVDLGANVNISDAHGGFTPLHLMMIRMPLKKEILDSEVRLLRDLVLKTDPNLKDNFDYRAKDSLTLRFPVELQIKSDQSLSLDKYTGYWRTTQYDQDVSKRGAYLCPYNWESVRDGSFWTNQVSDMSGEHPTPNDYMTANHLSRDQLLDPYRDFYEHNTLSGAVLEAFAL